MENSQEQDKIFTALFKDPQTFKVVESFVVLNLTDNLPLAKEFYKYWRDVEMEIYSKSIYEEQWKYDLVSLLN